MIKKLIDLYMVIYRIWMGFPEKVRFVLVGGYNTVIHYIIYVLILWSMDERYPQLALFISFAISTFHSYLTQKFYVFGTRGNYVREYPKCFLSWSIGYVLNSLLLAMFMHVFSLNPYIAEAFALVIGGVYSYVVLKYFAFCGVNKKQ